MPETRQKQPKIIKMNRNNQRWTSYMSGSSSSRLENRAKVIKLEPELTKSKAKIEKSALNRPKWLPDGSQDIFRQKVPSLLFILRFPPAAQSRPKIDSWVQKKRQAAIFY